MAAKKEVTRKVTRIGDSPGALLEMAVARIQQMMDPNSTVTHDEVLEDRVGNKRQYDVVIRGIFGGRSVLGIIECKDHSRRKGPDAMEAFAKKTENLGANLRVMVSRRGFTKQALKLAKHENIGCLSVLPGPSEQVGFSIGDTWYGVIRRWAIVRLTIHFALPNLPIASFEIGSVRWNGKLVLNWFMKELLTTHRDEPKEGEHTFQLMFSQPRNVEVEGAEYPVAGVSCIADRVFRKKKKWVSWSGDAFLDWHSGQFTIPPGGMLVGSEVESDLTVWEDYDGDLPSQAAQQSPGFLVATLYNTQKWDDRKDGEVPDLGNL